MGDVIPIKSRRSILERSKKGLKLKWSLVSRMVRLKGLRFYPDVVPEEHRTRMRPPKNTIPMQRRQGASLHGSDRGHCPLAMVGDKKGHPRGFFRGGLFHYLLPFLGELSRFLGLSRHNGGLNGTDMKGGDDRKRRRGHRSSGA